MIERRIPYYKLGECDFSPIKDTAFLGAPFVLRLPPIPAEEGVLFDAGECLSVRLVCRSITDTDELTQALKRDNGFYFNEVHERFLVAELAMRRRHSAQRETFTLFLPLSMPEAKNATLYLQFDGVFVRYLSDNAVLNENAGQDLFPYTERIARDAGAQVSSVIPSLAVRYEREERGADFYMPLPYNAYAGDVMNFYHNGVYHLLYLLDRRHHGSRNGAGAHYIAHVTTRDFLHWREEEPVVTLDVPYESHGTGTMLYHNGKYYMSYGLHTERYIDAEGLGLLSYGEGGTVAEEIPESHFLAQGLVPAGATYAVSEDGVHFEKSHCLFHVGRNPSVYANERGGISLYSGYEGKGTWESEGFGKPFRLVNANFPPVGTLPMRQTGECPSFFSMKGYRYLIMGFTGYFRTLAPSDGEYTDVSALGEEIYEGLGVPMVASVGERRFMAGWLDGTGWGSAILHRELLCGDGGRLLTRWVPELVPKLREENLWRDAKGDTLALPKGEGCLISFRARVGKDGKLACILEDDGGRGVELCIDGARRRLQASPAAKEGFATSIPSMLEQFKACDDSIDWYGKTGCKQIPRYSVDFSVAAPTLPEDDFTVRILVRPSRKLGATVLDMEADCKQTLASVRRGFFPCALRFLSERGEVADITLARMLYLIE